MKLSKKVKRLLKKYSITRDEFLEELNEAIDFYYDNINKKEVTYGGLVIEPVTFYLLTNKKSRHYIIKSVHLKNSNKLSDNKTLPLPVFDVIRYMSN